MKISWFQRVLNFLGQPFGHSIIDQQAIHASIMYTMQQMQYAAQAGAAFATSTKSAGSTFLELIDRVSLLDFPEIDDCSFMTFSSFLYLF